MQDIPLQNVKACPICGYQRIRTRLTTPSFTIRYCPHCTNAWTDPAPATIEYEREDFHSFVSEQNSQEPDLLALIEPQWRESLQMQVRLLSKHLPQNASILEIGCGQGLLLRELNKSGYKVTGVEPSVTASAAARKAGLNVVTGYFPQAVPSAHYDAVILSHVLEHLADPLHILREVQRIAAGGIALLVQTNWQGLVPTVYRARWYAWVPKQHFWHFTPKGLQTIYDAMQWRTIAVEYSTLIHRENVLTRSARLFSPLLDQFHLLAQLP